MVQLPKTVLWGLLGITLGSQLTSCFLTYFHPAQVLLTISLLVYLLAIIHQTFTITALSGLIKSLKELPAKFK